MLSDDDRQVIEDAAEGESHWLHRESYAPLAAKEFASYISKTNDLRLLDAGCGQGHDVRKFIELGFRAEGIDLSSKFLAEGRKLFPDINISEGDIEALPFADDEFDLVYCRNVIFYTLPEKSITELQRVLRPGGIGHLSLDEKIIKLEDDSMIHSADVEKMCALLDKSEIVSKEYKERVDQTPWPHRHYYYDVYFRTA